LLVRVLQVLLPCHRRALLLAAASAAATMAQRQREHDHRASRSAAAAAFLSWFLNVHAPMADPISILAQQLFYCKVSGRYVAFI
jgi:hypothetical protein